ncbi:SMI1/KNR4 family protein [Actinoplanes sp. NPDC026670]|uniref:SMI1/KNR4 family protein n=1 Tax=Actinoplanes sp. NPDC026670 TaxID=3154700 RepID=UPI0033C9C654
MLPKGECAVSVESLLADLEDWLRSNAPKTYALLGQSATSDQLSRLEAMLGFKLRPEFIATLRWHNGTAQGLGSFELAPSYRLLDADSIRSAASRLNASAAESDIDPWSQRWVPLGSDDCGGHLLVDHDEGEDCGLVFTWDPENGFPMETWPSLMHVYVDLKTALLHHSPMASCAHQVVDGGLEWFDIDVEHG